MAHAANQLCPRVFLSVCSAAGQGTGQKMHFIWESAEQEKMRLYSFLRHVFTIWCHQHLLGVGCNCVVVPESISSKFKAPGSETSMRADILNSVNHRSKSFYITQFWCSPRLLIPAIAVKSLQSAAMVGATGLSSRNIFKQCNPSWTIIVGKHQQCFGMPSGEWCRQLRCMSLWRAILVRTLASNKRLRRATRLSEALQGVGVVAWVHPRYRYRITEPRVYPSNERKTSGSNENLSVKQLTMNKEKTMIKAIKESIATASICSHTGEWEAARPGEGSEPGGRCLLDEVARRLWWWRRGLFLFWKRQKNCNSPFK